jgi:hypothetical protein
MIEKRITTKSAQFRSTPESKALTGLGASE